MVYFTFAARPNLQNPQKQALVITAGQTGGEKEPLLARSSKTCKLKWEVSGRGEAKTMLDRN